MSTQFGSFQNQIAGTNPELVPTVGMGATLVHWSDMHAATVVKVSPTGKTVWIQRDTAKRTDSNGMSESQSYTFEPNPQGEVYEVRKGKNGWKVLGDKTKVTLGRRCEYYDYSF